MKRSARVEWLEYASFIYRHHRLTVWITAIIYVTTFVVMLYGVLANSEIMSNRYVTVSFLLTVVVIPFVLMGFNFLVQLTTTLAEAKSRELQLEAKSRFLSAIEGSITHSAISRTFLTHLLADWEESMTKLMEGVITIQKDYWELSAELFEFAQVKVECTSLVPLMYWEKDNPLSSPKLLKYKEAQVQRLLRRPRGAIPVYRTFLLQTSELASTADYTRFFKIVREHLSDGFRLYYILEQNYATTPDAFADLAKDFAVIDDRLVMVGRFATHDKMVYHYDFFDLTLIDRNPGSFEIARSVFSNGAAVVAGQPGRLKIQENTARRRIDTFPTLNDKLWEADRLAIEALVQQLAASDSEYR